MDLIQIIVLAIVQGLTEFLPVSSSAHLILAPRLFGWQDQGLVFDVAVHAGSLLAVVYYFRRQLVSMTREWLASLINRRLTPDARLAWAVLFGTIPVGVVGVLGESFIENTLRSPLVIAWATIGFGALLWWADSRGAREREEHGMTWRDVVIIGAAQALALIPGTSRSGITITAGLACGLTREAAARFSFLLSIPVILAATGQQSLSLARSGGAVPWPELAVAMVLSAISAYLCIHWFLKLLSRIGMTPFVIYRLILGVVLIIVFA